MGRNLLSRSITGWLFFMILWLHASSLWAQLQYDVDGDCDVDGSDICQFLSRDNYSLENYLIKTTGSKNNGVKKQRGQKTTGSKNNGVRSPHLTFQIYRVSVRGF
jgi:hypothetical protein